MEIVDAHVHLGQESSYKTSPNIERLKMHGYQYQLWNDPQTFLQAMDILGIAKAVIFPFPFQETDVSKANKYILNCTQSLQGRFLPVGLIHYDIQGEYYGRFLGFKQHTVTRI